MADGRDVAEYQLLSNVSLGCAPGALSSLFTAAYITLYNLGIKLFQQPSLVVLHMNIWPLFLGRHGGLGVAQRQYAQTGRVNPRYLPSILLQGFTACGVVLPLAQRVCLFFYAEAWGASLLID